MSSHEYPIIGAGSAGCVLANRVSVGGASALLLEAGGGRSHLGVKAPAAFSTAWLRANCEHEYHSSRTCRIGAAEDGGVDPELRMHGRAGLRAADASVMPRITSGNINAPTVMIAERAADLVRAG
jgi:choline dehydrogenase